MSFLYVVASLNFSNASVYSSSASLPDFVFARSSKAFPQLLYASEYSGFNSVAALYSSIASKYSLAIWCFSPVRKRLLASLSKKSAILLFLSFSLSSSLSLSSSFSRSTFSFSDASSCSKSSFFSGFFSSSAFFLMYKSWSM